MEKGAVRRRDRKVAVTPAFELVETMLLQRGKVYLLERHLARLAGSAAHFGFDYPAEKLRIHIEREARRSARKTRKLRLLLKKSGEFSVRVTRIESAPTASRVKVSAVRVDPADEFYLHKTTHRPVYEQEREIATDEGYDEVIFVNVRGEITEGSITNVFVKKNGLLLTPPVSSGLLPGTFRGELLAAGECRERILYPSSLQSADAVFLGNSVRRLVRAIVDPA